MDYKGRNIVFVCILTFIEIWRLISEADVIFTRYHSDPNLVGYWCGPTETAFEIDHVFDPIRCARICYFDNSCRSVFYSPYSYKCIGCRVSYGVHTCNHETYLGSKYFRSEPTYTSDTDCKDVFENRCSAPSGLYEVSLWNSKILLTVLCDMDTDGGGWTVFQNRFDGSVNFTRDLFDYEYGFGDINGEFWLGLKHIQELAGQGTTDIRLEMTRSNGEKYYQRYANFELVDGTDYKITFEEGPADGTPGIADSHDFNYHNGKRFSTFDRDMDGSDGNDNYCAKQNRGGWWYDNCGTVYLNGKYCTPGEPGGSACLTFEGIDKLESLKASRILIRRV